MYIGNENTLNILLMIKRNLDDTTEIDKKIHQEKIGLRNRYREEKRYDDGWEMHSLGDGYDSLYLKKVIPYEMSETEIAEFRENNWCEWYNPYGDGRDCTGVWFTTRIRCFVVQGKTFIYHFKSCDV